MILVVDDDEMVRRTCCAALSSQGHSVAEARDGAEALERADSLGRPLDLLVSDIVMPRVDGIELAQTLTKRQPGLKVLFICGYVETKVFAGDSNSDMLLKPFTHEAFLERVYRLLEQPARKEASTERGSDLSRKCGGC